MRNKHIGFLVPAQKDLSGVTVYLSGPIQFAEDDGVTWRQEVRELIKEFGLPLRIIDPCNKGDDVIHEIGEDRELLNTLKSQGKFEEVRNIMKSIRRWDLRAVDYSNFLIVRVDPTVPTWGTVDECVVAERQQKPILVIVKGGCINCPDWLLAMVRIEEVFSSCKTCVEYLNKLHSGNIPMDDRWVTISGRNPTLN